MPRICTICSHPKRSEIDAALVAAQSYRGIAQQYAASPDAVFRHRQHVAASLAKAKEAVEAARGDNLMEKVYALEVDARRALERAEGIAAAEGQDAKTALDATRTALLACRELGRQLELLAKLRGELKEGVTVNVTTAVGVQVASMTLEEQEARVRNATAAIARLREKAAQAIEMLPLPHTQAGRVS